MDKVTDQGSQKTTQTALESRVAEEDMVRYVPVVPEGVFQPGKEKALRTPLCGLSVLKGVL